MDSWKGEWGKLEIVVDSGATEWMAPESVAKSMQLEETDKSKNGVWYEAANGAKIESKSSQTSLLVHIRKELS